MLDGEAPRLQKTGWQARATRQLRPSAEPLLTHMRRRLDRWKVEILPGHRCDMFVRNSRCLGKLVPPRVMAATLRAATNGWITARRMQKAGVCVLACTGAEDSIEHYAHCKLFHQLCLQQLRIQPEEPCDRIPALIGLRYSADILPQNFIGDDSDREKAAITARAVAVYSLYRCHNAVRHGLRHGVDAQQAFAYCTQEAVRDHEGAKRTLRNIRAPQTISPD